MRIDLALLKQRYRPELPDDHSAVCQLLDDVGIEVKRCSQDGIATLEFLANRGDHHCYLGIARELGGRLKVNTALPDAPPLRASAAHSASCVTPDLRIETQQCLAFGLATCTLHPQASLQMDWIRHALQWAEAYTGLPAVDLANFVGLEIGHPLHLFDADQLVGTLCVRLSRPGERAHLLHSDQPSDIPPGLVVVADDLGIACVAGVIGTRRTAVGPQTRHVLIESALYDPIAIRKAARALKIQTAAATRFERGADPDLVTIAAARAIALMRENGLLSTDSPNTWTSVDVPMDARLQGRTIDLDWQQLNAYYAQTFAPDAVCQHLHGLGFRTEALTPTTLRVSVPGARLWDVIEPECLFEEIGRSVGFDSFPGALPPMTTVASPSREQSTRTHIEEVLLGYGFFEVITDGFYGRSDVDRLGLPHQHPLTAHVELRNALDKGYSLLKNNALIQALNLADTNQRYGLPAAKYFEFTHLFELQTEAQAVERPVLWGMLWGKDETGQWQKHPPADFWYLKGVVEEIARACGRRLSLRPSHHAPKPIMDLMHPHRTACLCLDDTVVGLCGELHPALTARWKLKVRAVHYFELDWHQLLQSPGAQPALSSDPTVPEYQAIKRSVCLHLPRHLNAAQVQDAMHTASPLELDGVRVCDLFEQDAVRAHTFELVFRNDNTLSAQHINEALAHITAQVLSLFGSQGVYQR